MNYKVTIGIPVYNAEHFIQRTMESVLTQTFENIEILIIDDCGTDYSIPIIQKIKNEHPRGNDVRILRQPCNMGVGEARNRIIDEAQGKYLYFMDSDDIITEQTISILYDSIKKNNAEIAFGSYKKIETYNDNRISDIFSYPDKIFTQANQFADYAFRKYGGIQACVWNYLIDIDFLRKTSLRFTKAPYWEDMTFTYKLATYVQRAVLLSQITYYYMCRENSLSNYQQRKSISKSEVLRNVNTIELLKQHSLHILNKPYLGKWCYNMLMTDFYIICNCLKNKNIIQPKLTEREQISFLRHPLLLKQILCLKTFKSKNIVLYILSILPARISIKLIEIIGKRKGVI